MTHIECIIDSKKRRKEELLEKMLHELSRTKSSIADYQDRIRTELDTSKYLNDVIYREDECKWIECHHDRFLKARNELLEVKAYLLAHYDTKDCK
jgi:hypothetical protein